MNPQNEPNNNPGGIVGGEVAPATPPANEAPVGAPVDVAPVQPEPVMPDQAPIAAPEAGPAPVEAPQTTFAPEEPLPTSDIAVGGAQKSANKGIFIAIIILVLALVCGGVAFLLFGGDSDEKIIQDAWHNLFVEKNKMDLGVKVESTAEDGSVTKFDVQVNAISKDKDAKAAVTANVEAMNTSMKISAEVISKDGDIYAKTDLGAFSAYFEYDKEWIKIPKDYLTQMTTGSSDSETCVTNAVKAMVDSVEQQDELLTALTSTEALSYERASANGDIVTYNVLYDMDKGSDLANSFKQTAIYKSISACNTNSGEGSDIAEDAIDSASGVKPTITFTVDKKTRQFTSLNLTAEQDGTKVSIVLTGSGAVDENVEISAPTGETVDFSEVMYSLSGMFGGSSSYMTSDQYEGYVCIVDDFEWQYSYHSPNECSDEGGEWKYKGVDMDFYNYDDYDFEV